MYGEDCMDVRNTIEIKRLEIMQMHIPQETEH